MGKNNQAYFFVFNKPIFGVVVDPNNYIINSIGSIIHEISVADAPSFYIGPNPCNEVLNINFIKNIKNYSLKVVDIMGKDITFAKNFSGAQFDLNTSELKSGIYFIEISNGINKSVKKFIKQ